MNHRCFHGERETPAGVPNVNSMTLPCLSKLSFYSGLLRKRLDSAQASLKAVYCNKCLETSWEIHLFQFVKFPPISTESLSSVTWPSSSGIHQSKLQLHSRNSRTSSIHENYDILPIWILTCTHTEAMLMCYSGLLTEGFFKERFTYIDQSLAGHLGKLTASKVEQGFCKIGQVQFKA